MKLHLRPLTLKQANQLVAELHRHHKPVVTHRFSIGLYDENGVMHGAVIVNKPVARLTPQYKVAEVSRLVTDGTPNACSMLYGAAARAAQAMGFERIQTYILNSEPGTSLKASGWKLEGITKATPWNNKTRKRNDSHPVVDKQRWGKRLNPEWAGDTD
ncbi:XF1762 family protein [Streptomyces radicis]|uniref:N-acetyltransferase n=1 Tax=Streptomyces radicis TaxID=1750517 RepID=A0A3A9WAI6_9ACTN|nr:XF1762 family protein [Streptomyces radicis]RKN09652.1 hypothetical protein D7319_11360 [Streptomyces radicis]